MRAPRTYLTTKQVEQVYPYPRSTQAKDRMRGTGPRYFKVGKKILYDPADIEAWLEQHRRRSTSDTGADGERVAAAAPLDIDGGDDLDGRAVVATPPRPRRLQATSHRDEAGR